jgi:glycosyltransferase involved in cell wall biosynthesis
MKVSIITVCFNSASTILDTIQSIAEQNYKDFEHIIVDGASTDGTREIIANATSVSSYISEPDEGIYDAMNKGIAMANGDIIGILNADDFYANDDVLSQIAKAFEEPEIDACYADLVYVRQDDTNKVVRYWKSCPYKNGLFRSGWMPAHPTFFCRKSVYEKYGNFNLNYKIAADVELLFRLLGKYRIKTAYLPKTLIKMRLGGTTNQSWSNICRQNNEVLSALDKHYGRVSRLSFFLGKILNRSSQFFRKPRDI